MAHAEVEAFRDAERRGHDVRGATLYVTLEPCCTHGRTPPCTDAILRAGVGRVVVATRDPNPAHGGRGLEILRAGGVEVVEGPMGAVAARMNAGFNHWIVHGRPMVTLKAGMSIDGKIATRTGESRWVTSEASRAAAMQLRGEHDAILVGIGTVLADDPALTVRLGEKERSPVRVVLDSRARTPLGARLVTDAHAGRTVVVTTRRAPGARVRKLRERVTVWEAPEGGDGRVDLGWFMGELGRMPVTSVLVEGGGEVHGAFLTARMAQRVRFFYGAVLIGGEGARPAVGGAGLGRREDMPGLGSIRWRRHGDDWSLSAEIEWP